MISTPAQRPIIRAECRNDVIARAKVLNGMKAGSSHLEVILNPTQRNEWTNLVEIVLQAKITAHRLGILVKMLELPYFTWESHGILWKFEEIYGIPK